MLVLTGPCGAGKTALVRVLAKELGCDLCEWVNPPMPVVKDVDGRMFVSFSMFADFITDHLTVPYMPRLLEFQKWLRFASLYPSLSFYSSLFGDRKRSQGLFSTSQKILVVEDLPFLSDVAKSEEFRQIVRDFLNSTRYPLIFILSDTYRIVLKTTIEFR